MAGSSVRSGRAETTKLPKATSRHLPVVLASRDSLEREGYLERKLGELGCPSDKEGVRVGKYPAMAGTAPPGGETSCLEFQ